MFPVASNAAGICTIEEVEDSEKCTYVRTDPFAIYPKALDGLAVDDVWKMMKTKKK